MRTAVCSPDDDRRGLFARLAHAMSAATRRKPRYATGGVIPAGQPFVVGEAGPEPFIVPTKWVTVTSTTDTEFARTFMRLVREGIIDLKGLL